jgi:hypothetical protein
MNEENIGSTFDSWLREEGIHEETTAAAIQRVLERQAEVALRSRDPIPVRSGDQA